MKKVIFRLNIGKNPISWLLKTEGAMANKEGKGSKFINYFKGEDSIFVEDIKNKDIKPSKVPSFELNPVSGFTELSVSESDKNLISYLEAHPWFGKKFVRFSKEEQVKKDLDNYNLVEEAFELIKESDPFKIQAMAMVVFGTAMYGRTSEECQAKLKEKAMKDPKVIIEAFKADNYENKYLSGIAFSTGVIENNASNTAVVWGDNKGVILHVATGENGIDKLTDHLAKSNESSMVLLQELQTRLDEKLAKQTVPTDTDQTQLLNDKDKEIEELKKKLAASQKEKKETDTPLKKEDVSKEGTSAQNPDTEKSDDLKLDEASKQYKEKFEKEVPINKKSNLEWIQSKLQE